MFIMLNILGTIPAYTTALFAAATAALLNIALAAAIPFLAAYFGIEPIPPSKPETTNKLITFDNFFMPISFFSFILYIC